MSLTAIGIIQALIGLGLLFAGSLRAMFLFLIIAGLFGGSGSILFPSLGGSSVPPLQFALPFVFLRLLMPSGGLAGLLAEAFRSNAWLVAFTFYGIVAAFVGPRIFSGAIDVYPLRFDDPRNLFDTLPLAPSPQNITAAINLLGSLMVALASYMFCRTWAGARALVSGAIASSWLLVTTGLLGVAVNGTPADAAFEWIRNGNYAQLDQSFQGFLRISGTFPEASGFAAYAFAWFVFSAELWYRSIRPRATGIAALALGLVLFFSTSSTAYIGMGSYILFLILRLLLLPTAIPMGKVGGMLLTALGAAVALSLALALAPGLAEALFEMVRHMTVDKQNSNSGQQRLFWAMQGIEAFKVSWGIGIGPGSFRSSSVITAIIGSMGMVGIVSFLGYFLAVLKPGRQSTWVPVNDEVAAIGAAASCTFLLVLVPSAVSSPSVSAGNALFAGAALALRSYAVSTARMGSGYSQEVQQGLSQEPSDALSIDRRSREGRLGEPPSLAS